MTSEDVHVEGYLLSHHIELLALRPGDILLCRPQNPLSEDATSKIHHQLCVMTGENPNIRIMVVPSTWDIGVARRRDDDEAIEGLRELISDLSD